jgi:hypothetical protein
MALRSSLRDSIVRIPLPPHSYRLTRQSIYRTSLSPSHPCIHNKSRAHLDCNCTHTHHALKYRISCRSSGAPSLRCAQSCVRPAYPVTSIRSSPSRITSRTWAHKTRRQGGDECRCARRRLTLEPTWPWLYQGELVHVAVSHKPGELLSMG